MCGLSLAWVTSENSTSTSNADILSRSSSLDPILSPTVSGVQCWLPLSVVPRQLSAACLSAVQPPTALFPVPRQLPLSRPLPTSRYSEISCLRILCLVSRQNRQLNRLLWQPNHIVLHYANKTFFFNISAARRNWMPLQYWIFSVLNNAFNWNKVHIYPTPPLMQDITQGQFLRGV